MTAEDKKDRFAAARAAKAAKAAASIKGDAPQPAKAADQPLTDDWGSVSDGSADAGDWGVIDLGAQRAELPPAGWHAATVADVKITGKAGLVLWCSISYALTGTTAVVQELQPIKAKPDAPVDQARRVEDGRKMLGRIQAATGVDLTGAKLTDIGERLIGKPCFVLVAHGVQYGVPVLNFRSVSGEAR